MTDVSKSYSSDGRALLSVSIIKDVEGIDSLENMIAKELEALTGINANHFEHVKTFSIDKALPILSEVKTPSHYNMLNCMTMFIWQGIIY